MKRIGFICLYVISLISANQVTAYNNSNFSPASNVDKAQKNTTTPHLFNKKKTTQKTCKTHYLSLVLHFIYDNKKAFFIAAGIAMVSTVVITSQNPPTTNYRITNQHTSFVAGANTTTVITPQNKKAFSSVLKTLPRDKKRHSHNVSSSMDTEIGYLYGGYAPDESDTDSVQPTGTTQSGAVPPSPSQQSPPNKKSSSSSKKAGKKQISFNPNVQYDDDTLGQSDVENLLCQVTLKELDTSYKLAQWVLLWECTPSYSTAARKLSHFFYQQQMTGGTLKTMEKKEFENMIKAAGVSIKNCNWLWEYIKQPKKSVPIPNKLTWMKSNYDKLIVLQGGKSSR